MSTLPSVTIAIPAYNEAAKIEAVVAGFLNQKYPGLVEILVADGGSTDGTQDIVKQIAIRNPAIRLLHNPQRIQSAALNLMLREAKGDIFLRADAHCDYAPDYIQKSVDALTQSGALNAGGAQRFVAETVFQTGVALASRSIFGNGGAKYRDPNYNGSAETVFLGCFWKSDLLQLGGFNIAVHPNEDAELNLRLLDKNPNAVYVSSDIKAWYYPRRSAGSLWKQFFKYGCGRHLTSKRHPGKSPLRTKLPIIGILVFLLSFVLTTLFWGLNIALLISLLIIAMPALESVRVALKYNSVFEQDFWRGSQSCCPSLLARCFYCWIALSIMPVAYASGGIFQMIRHNILKRKDGR